MMKLSQSKNLGSGFTLIELLIVVSIIGIVAVIAVPSFQKFVFDAQEAEGTKMLLEAYRDQQRVAMDCQTGRYNCPTNEDGTPGIGFTELISSGDSNYPTLMYRPAGTPRFNLITGNLDKAFFSDAAIPGAKFSLTPTDINSFGYMLDTDLKPDHNKFLMGAQATMNGNIHLLAIDEKGVLYKVCDAWQGSAGSGSSVYKTYASVDPTCGPPPTTNNGGGGQTE